MNCVKFYNQGRLDWLLVGLYRCQMEYFFIWYEWFYSELQACSISNPGECDWNSHLGVHAR